MQPLTNLLIYIKTILICLFLTGCQPDEVSLNGQTMGTYYAIKYIDKGLEHSLNSKTIQQAVDKRLEDVNDKMSTYRPDSELSRINRSRVANNPITLSTDTAKVIAEAIRINHISQGTLDITLGPLVNLWGFGPEGSLEKKPSDEQIKQRFQWTGINKLSLEGNQLTKKIPQLYIDLSAIAKGFGVDVIAEYLESIDIHDYMVDIGGEVRTKGLNHQGKGWRIAIEKPDIDARQTVQEVLLPGNNAIATSGSYRNFFEENGIRYSHTIDPKTGYPIVNDVVSVTVIHPSCMTADGFATVFTVLGAEKSIELAEQQGIAVFIITQSKQGFVEHYSSAFKQYLQAK